MSLWELMVCAEGVRRANSPPGERAAKPPTAQEHFEALKRIAENG